MSSPMQRAPVSRDLSLVPLAKTGERAARPSPRVKPTKAVSKEKNMSPDRTLEIADVPADVLAAYEAEAASRANASAFASARVASAAQQDVLGQIPTPVAPVEQPVVSASGGYTKTRLGTMVLVGNVGHSRNIVAKRIGERDLVEFSLAARAFGAPKDEPTWYRVTVWDGDEATLDLIRQGTYLQVKGQGVQSQSHKTGKIFLDVNASRIAAGPEKGQQLSVAGSVVPQRGYFRRLFDALFGR